MRCENLAEVDLLQKVLVDARRPLVALRLQIANHKALRAGAKQCVNAVQIVLVVDGARDTLEQLGQRVAATEPRVGIIIIAIAIAIVGNVVFVVIIIIVVELPEHNRVDIANSGFLLLLLLLLCESSENAIGIGYKTLLKMMVIVDETLFGVAQRAKEAAEAERLARIAAGDGGGEAVRDNVAHALRLVVENLDLDIGQILEKRGISARVVGGGVAALGEVKVLGEIERGALELALGDGGLDARNADLQRELLVTQHVVPEQPRGGASVQIHAEARRVVGVALCRHDSSVRRDCGVRGGQHSRVGGGRGVARGARGRCHGGRRVRLRKERRHCAVDVRVGAVVSCG
jgi:hypothetical protein